LYSSRVQSNYCVRMPRPEPKPPRQLHLRIPDDAFQALTDRAQAMGISRETWVTRAVLHALEHAKTTGEPQALRLPWSALL
jgi:predicted HicB family RNase H-like nuclease